MNGTAKPSLVLAKGSLVTHAFTKSVMQLRHSLVKDGMHPVMRGIAYWRVSFWLIQSDDNVHTSGHVRVIANSAIPPSANPDIYVNGFVGGRISHRPWCKGNRESPVIVEVPPIPMAIGPHPIIIISNSR